MAFFKTGIHWPGSGHEKTAEAELKRIKNSKRKFLDALWQIIVLSPSFMKI
ncbi:MAG TPA: hypothetical protein PK165_02360 [bacterium]|nr:hypothetical protein [bacterium]HOL50173.1 hypothetical protein [bacterium]HPO51660.1 hypothetical protein [bacterium]HXK45032.1 hypothetical protein [bacterium]